MTTFVRFRYNTRNAGIMAGCVVVLPRQSEVERRLYVERNFFQRVSVIA